MLYINDLSLSFFKYTRSQADLSFTHLHVIFSFVMYDLTEIVKDIEGETIFTFQCFPNYFKLK